MPFSIKLKKKNNMRKIFLTTVIVLAFAAAGFVLIINRPEDVNKISQSPSPTITHDGWQIYSNTKIGFMMNYDSSLILRQNSENDVQFYMYGPTQSEGTEIYDGILVSVQKVAFTGNFESYIEEQIKMFEDLGSIVEPLHEADLNGVPVKTFTGSALGEFTLIFMPVETNSLLMISYLVADPGNFGFQAKVDQMLSTFNLVVQ